MEDKKEGLVIHGISEERWTMQRYSDVVNSPVVKAIQTDEFEGGAFIKMDV